MWEAVVLNSIIRDEARPVSGEWDAETVVRALGVIRADRALARALDQAAPSKVIASFLRTYQELLGNEPRS